VGILRPAALVLFSISLVGGKESQWLVDRLESYSLHSLSSAWGAVRSLGSMSWRLLTFWKFWHTHSRERANSLKANTWSVPMERYRSEGTGACASKDLRWTKPPQRSSGNSPRTACLA